MQLNKALYSIKIKEFLSTKTILDSQFKHRYRSILLYIYIIYIYIIFIFIICNIYILLYIIYNNCIICAALRDLILFVHIKKHEKHPWKSATIKK